MPRTLKWSRWVTWFKIRFLDEYPEGYWEMVTPPRYQPDN